MAQAISRIKSMPLDTHTPYYTLKPRKNHVIRAKNQVLQVISGLAWISHNGEDFILKAGDTICLTRGGDVVVMVSGLFGKSVQYTLRD